MRAAKPEPARGGREAQPQSQPQPKPAGKPRRKRKSNKPRAKTSPRNRATAPPARTTAALEGALGSSERRAAVVLEVLAGVRSVAEAAAALGLSVNYYYLLERQAIAGLVSGCAPRPRGKPVPGAERQVARLERELARCRQECQRQAALVRAAERTFGLAERAAAGGSRRAKASASASAKAAEAGAAAASGPRRRPTVRALRAATALRRADAESAAPSDRLLQNSSWSNTGSPLEPRSDPVAADPSAAKLEREPASGVAPDEESSDGAHRMQTIGSRACGTTTRFTAGQTATGDDPADAQRRADD